MIKLLTLHASREEPVASFDLQLLLSQLRSLAWCEVETVSCSPESFYISIKIPGSDDLQEAFLKGAACAFLKCNGFNVKGCQL